MKDWRDYFRQWEQQPLRFRSVGKLKDKDHFKNIQNHICSLLNLSNSDLVIDVGCDSGLLTCGIAYRSHRIVGVDFIEGFVRDAIQKGCFANCYYAVADARWLPFKDRVFDKAYCYNMIHNLPEKADGIKVIDELIRVCKPSLTVLIGDIPNSEKKALYDRAHYHRAGLGKKARILFSRLLPKRFKSIIKILFGYETKERGPEFVWYDLHELASRFRERGFHVDLFAQKKDLHDHFYRDNLIIKNEYAQS